MATNIPGFREDDSWFSREQLTRVAPADEAEVFRSPVPTQMVSNGEYMPCPQTAKQQRVEARIKELAERVSRDLGMTRRQFLPGTGGMAAAFLAMNEVFGEEFFKVRHEEMYERAAFAENGIPADVFVFDDQLRTVRSSRLTTGQGLRAIAQGFPNIGITRPPKNISESELGEFLSAPQTAAVRDFVNKSSGTSSSSSSIPAFSTSASTRGCRRTPARIPDSAFRRLLGLERPQ